MPQIQQENARSPVPLTDTKVSTDASTSRRASSSKLLNPYAKKNTTPSTSAIAAPILAPTLINVKAQRGPTNPYQKRQAANENTQAIRTSPLPPPPPVNEFTTFSQAFGNADPDADALVDKEQPQPISFDRGIAVNTHNDDIKNNVITPRDNHVMLQPHMLHISTRQRGNPIIEYIRNVPYKFSELVPDYIMAATRCALFLSLRYHNLHPHYIHRRIAELKSDFEYRMLLCLVDIEDSAPSILFLNDLCVQNNYTLILAWSDEEAARYLETVRAFDGKDPTPVIGKHEPKTHIEKVIRALGSIPSVNKSDASQLLSQFGCFRNLVSASIEELSVVPGIGPKKVRRLHEAFHRPFVRDKTKKSKEKESEKKDEGEQDGGARETKLSNTDSEVAVPKIISKK
jgi:DNA excision repair protein ERCC-1